MTGLYMLLWGKAREAKECGMKQEKKYLKAAGTDTTQASTVVMVVDGLPLTVLKTETSIDDGFAKT